MKNAYLAEFIGTFSLSLVVLVMAGTGSPYTSFAAALTLGLFVYMVGSISGTHINPAVTIGLWYAKKIVAHDALAYIAAQFAGAISALFTANLLISDLAVKLKPVQTLVVNDPAVGLAEALGAFFLCFGVMAVVSGKVRQELSGVVIGGSLLIGLFVAGGASNAVLNPAVALALGSINSMYIAGPVIGALLGMRVFLAITSQKSTSSVPIRRIARKP